MIDTTTILIVWGVCALIGAAIGSSKGQGGLGFFLGLVLGIIGVIIIAVIKPPAPEPQQAGGWWPDPYGKHQHRYYDGRAWTGHVADNGQASFDPTTSPS